MAAVSWYGNRPVAPTLYPEFPITNIGITYKLTTKWQDGKVYYKFKVAPLDKGMEIEFDRAANSDAPKSFSIHLGDSGQFAIPNCELEITTLTPTIADNGLIESMDVFKIRISKRPFSLSDVPIPHRKERRIPFPRAWTLGKIYSAACAKAENRSVRWPSG